MARAFDARSMFGGEAAAPREAPEIELHDATCPIRRPARLYLSALGYFSCFQSLATLSFTENRRNAATSLQQPAAGAFTTMCVYPCSILESLVASVTLQIPHMYDQTGILY